MKNCNAFTMTGACQGAPLIGLRACGHAAFTMADRLSRLHNGLVGCRTMKNVTEGITPPCHREERANASDVAIHWRPWRFNGIATHPAAARNDACGQAAFTMADRLSRPTESGAIHLDPSVWTLSRAFTMAEILLSLTIIGVVAAITLPSLTGNINERTWNTQRKALYARFSQALALMPNLNGYGTLHAAGSDDSGSSYAAEDTAAEAFVTEGLSKVLKINNICDSGHLADCGIPGTINDLTGSVISSFNTSPYNTLHGFNSMFNGTFDDNGTSEGGTIYSYSQLDTKAAAFETANGESIVVYYNPNCVGDMQETEWHYTQPKMCANFVYDLNGNKGPNTVGKDIGFIAALYPSDPVIVAPLPYVTNAGYVKQAAASGLCQEQDSEARLPNRDELTAMFYNRTLLGISDGDFWSGSVISSRTTWNQVFMTGIRGPGTRTVERYVRCVKR